MGVTLQAGFLASCVVFGPMAMAGWHLTRNRVLFFSGSLFIVLAVSVHILPYFPMLNSFNNNSPEASSSVVLTASSPMNATLRHYCISNLHKVEFIEVSSNQTDGDHWDWRWEREPHKRCQYQKLDRSEALELLQGTWIVVAGDSQARLLYVSLLELTLASIEPLRPLLFKRHSNFNYSLESHRIRMDFIWAPYTVNLTQMVRGSFGAAKSPDIVVAGAGLWHMLHSGNHTEYGVSLVRLKRALASMPSGEGDGLSSQLFWVNLPTLVPSLLQSELKRQRMTSLKMGLYGYESNNIMSSSTSLLDVQLLSRRCGARCTLDGIHYCQAVYRAALHVMINNLLIVTKQTPVT